MTAEYVRDRTTGLLKPWNGYNGAPESRRLLGYRRDANTGLITAYDGQPDWGDLYMTDANGLVQPLRNQYAAGWNVLDWSAGHFQSAAGVWSSDPTKTFGGSWTFTRANPESAVDADGITRGPFPTNVPAWTNAGLPIIAAAAPSARFAFVPGTSGTIIAKAVVPAAASVFRLIGTDGTGAAGPIYATGGNVGTYNGTTTLEKAAGMVVGQVATMGVTWSAGRRSVTANGLAPATDALTFGAGINFLFLGSTNGITDFWNEKILSVQIGPGVTDGQLQTMTAQ